MQVSPGKLVSAAPGQAWHQASHTLERPGVNVIDMTGLLSSINLPTEKVARV